MALADPRFSTARVTGPSMLSLDGDRHRRHRDPFVSAYRPALVAERYPAAVEAAARSLVAELRPRGRAELRRELAGSLAVSVVTMSLGLEAVDPAQLIQWYHSIVAAVAEVSAGGDVPTGARRAYRDLGEALARAARRPGSALATAAAALPEEELVANAAVFLFGGIETSEGMTANLLVHLLSHPAVLDAVRSDPGLVDATIEESLRLEPAVARLDRYATMDSELAGVRISRGDPVYVSVAAANRDPAWYEAPDELRLDRPSARTHLTFAQGPHACIGQQLARMETRAAVLAMLELDDVHLVAAPVVTGFIFRKPGDVRVAWHRH